MVASLIKKYLKIIVDKLELLYYKLMCMEYNLLTIWGRNNLVKYFIIIFLIFCPLTIYSQILETGDIDIYIRNLENIQIILNNESAERDISKYNENNIKLYTYLIKILIRKTNIICSEDICPNNICPDDYCNYNFCPKIIEDFRTHYFYFMNIIPPNELMKTFELAGWRNTGQKKYLSIEFIYRFISLYDLEIYYAKLNFQKNNKTEYYLERLNLLENFYSIIIELINENDFDIVQSNMEELIKETTRLTGR
jgi:hypothetical protein